MPGSVTLSSKTDTKETKTDGRKLRSSRSRDKIKQSVLALIRAGHYTPRAVDISEHSGLSMRTVFRHIEDMESIGREVSEDLDREVVPIFMKPYESTNWKGRLSEMIEQRVEAYEVILPLRMHVALRRFRSEFLLVEYQRLLEFEKIHLEAILPESVKENKTLTLALNNAISIATWISLRLDLGCDKEEARKVLLHQVDCLIRETA